MRKTLPYLVAATLMIVLIASVLLLRESGPVVAMFEDITANSGISYTGMTHGAAWGDFDGDGLPDLYVTNHLKEARLYRNQGGGKFADVTSGHFSPKDLGGDKHGAAWADLDNDGRPDLVQLTGAIQGAGSEPKRLFLNRGAKFEEVAESAGVANPYGRTRMPLWLDLDGDGKLDLIHGAEARFDDRTPPFTFMQQGGRFAEALEALKFASRSVPFCIVTELNNDSHPELVCRVAGKNRTAQVFDTATLPARELDLLPVTAFEDIAAGDFDNDGAIDLFLARKNPPGAVAFGRPNRHEIIADLWINEADAAKPVGFSFRSSGELTFRIASVYPGDALTAERIHIGEQGGHPDGLGFTLSPQTAGVAGTRYQPGAQPGLYVGLTPPDKWQVFVSPVKDTAAGGKAWHQQISVKVGSTAPIAELAAMGDTARAEEAAGRLFMNRGGKLVEESDKRGVNERVVAAVNVVAGDFDNDMDLDLFVLGSGDVGRQENLLLLNRGDGYFDVVPAAGGAGGPGAGVGDGVTMADVDGDGFLDLLVATGGSMGRSLGLPSEGGGYHLYRNLGNANHWLEIDLEGSTSNRDGIGARVQITAGGVTQTRIQDGGVHHRGQNHSRLHFGLGRYTKGETITIRWPSGRIQESHDIGAGQVLRVREPE
jgi:ASPIC/UnbV protein/VCBS repeat protein